MKKIRLIIFDLDGTLLDTLDDIRSSINYTLRSYGFKEASREEVRRYVGHGFSNALKSALIEKASHYDENEFPLMLSMLRTHYSATAANSTRAYSGINNLLLDLKKEGFEVAVLTNKDDSTARSLISAFFPDVAFTFVEGKREGRPLKPDKALTLSLLEEHGIAPSEVLIVGDSEVDRETASNINAPSLIVNYGFRTKGELERSGIRDSLSSVEELRGVLLG